MKLLLCDLHGPVSCEKEGLCDFWVEAFKDWFVICHCFLPSLITSDSADVETSLAWVPEGGHGEPHPSLKPQTCEKHIGSARSKSSLFKATMILRLLVMAA